MHHAGLLHIVPHPPDGGVLHHEAVRLGQLIERVGRPFAPHINIVHLQVSPLD